MAIITKGYSQSHFDTFKKNVTTKNAVSKKDYVDSLLLLSTKEETIKIANDYAYLLSRANELKSAIYYGEKTIEKSKAYGIVNNRSYSISLYLLAGYYYKSKNYLKADQLYKEVITLNNHTLKVGQSYCGIGNCFVEIGDLYKAVDYYKQGLPYLKDNPMYYTNDALPLANIYEQIDTKESIENKRKLLENILKIQPTDSMIKSFTHHFYAFNDSYAIYYQNEWPLDFEKSKSYHLKNLKTSQKFNDDYLYTHVYTNLGSLYSTVKNDSAIYYLNKGFETANDNINRARNRNILALYYLKTKNSKVALEKANDALSYSLSSKNENELSAKQLLETSIDKSVTIWSFINKATALIQLYEKDNKNIEYIQEANKFLNTADKLIDEINTKELETNSKLYWRKEAADIYSKIVLCSNILDKPEDAVHALEKSKALLLTETILNNQSKNSIPENILLRENYLKNEINTLSFQLEEESQDSIQSQLFNSKNNYQAFIDSTRVNYPWFKSVDEKSKIYDLKTIQKSLSNDQVILWYTLSANTDYINKASVVLLTKNDLSINVIGDQENLISLVKEYSDLASRPLITNEGYKMFQKTSHSLYNILIPEGFQDKLKNKRIIIIPEGSLQNIPFESLITAKNSNDYLIYDSQISYAYSMSSLLHGQKVDRDADKTLIGFSPVSFEKDSLPQLTHSENEIKNIENFIEGDFYTYQNATSSSFLNKSQDYKIIHLATHADAASNPWIAFSDKKLRLHELYTYTNNSDLVVLSACNTSQGKLAKGEGVLSLARGFFHSGANSVIASLWNVNDKASSKIISEFYKNLKSGQSKVTALHNAKINYLKTNELAEASPYYWSSFILVGDTDSVELSSNYLLRYLLPILFILLIAYVIKHKYL